MASMPQDFKKKFKFLDILYFWFLLKSYHIILILIAPIGIGKTLNGASIKLSVKRIWFKWLRQSSRTFLMN